MTKKANPNKNGNSLVCFGSIYTQVIFQLYDYMYKYPVDIMIIVVTKISMDFYTSI